MIDCALKIRNRDQLISNASVPDDAEARRICLHLLEHALDAVDPRKVVKSVVNVKDDSLQVQDRIFDLTETERVLVVGAGKASGAMAEALEEILGAKIETGIINIPQGTKNLFKTERIELNEARHPIPDRQGEEGARNILNFLSRTQKNDLVICLISGGGSSLLPVPAGNVDLQDKVELTQRLLLSGATIKEINGVRKHISAIKGGQLALKADPAKVISLVISDVVGDGLGTIASGPTVPDSSTYQEAKQVLEKYDLWKDAPKKVKRHILNGVESKIEETPKPGNQLFNNVFNFIIANNETALNAMDLEAKKMHLNSIILSSKIRGEACEVGAFLGQKAKEIVQKSKSVDKPVVALAGGESTVTVLGKGVGGRNQEAMLSAAGDIQGLRGVAIASMGTDGVDGVTDAAGAIIDGQTIHKAEKLNLHVDKFLRNNDSYNFFKPLKDLMLTGPTQTNVNDVMVIVSVQS